MVRALRGWLLVSLTVLSILPACDSGTEVLIDSPVTDMADVLTDRQEAYLSDALRAHHKTTHVQLAVLTVPSTRGQPIEDFSHDVAQRWAGGDEGTDRGALFVLAVDDRRMRLELGRGLEADITDGQARIIIHRIKPELRASRYAAGVAKVVGAVFLKTGGAPDAVGQMIVDVPEGDAPRANVRRNVPPTAGIAALMHAPGRYVRRTPIVLVSFMGLAYWFVWLLVFVLRRRSSGPYAQYTMLRGSRVMQYGATGALFLSFVVDGFSPPVIDDGVLWLMGTGLAWGIVWWWRKWICGRLRFAPHHCAQCQLVMTRQDDESSALSEGQTVEVAITSREYDLWLCPQGHVSLEGYEGKTPAKQCPKCGFYTLFKGKSVVKAATYSSAGLRETSHSCLHCSYSHVSRTVLPKRVRSSSSGSWGDGDGGFSGGCDSGGGYSGGGYSGGGGSFGGGGASSSW